MRPKTSIQKYEIPKNCPFPLPFLTVIAFHRVKKSPLIIGIVYRILKITSEQLFPFNESELSHSANCRYNLRLFRLFRGDSSGMDKSSSAKCLLYSDVEKGEPSPTGTARTKKKQRRKRQSRSWGFSFHKHFTAFFYLFLFFNYFTLSFFPILFLPSKLTHTHTHDPHQRPTTHTHYPRHLATLARYSALSVRMRLFNEVEI